MSIKGKIMCCLTAVAILATTGLEAIRPAFGSAPALSGSVVVYSGMPLTFVQPIFDKFEAQTGVRVEFVAAGT